MIKLLKRIGVGVANAGLKVKFLLFYLFLVLIPLMLFLNWYSTSLIAEQRINIKNEKNQGLRQSVNVLDSQLLITESINSSLQSNLLLIKLLENQYSSASEELYTYLVNIRPDITRLPIYQPILEEVYIYRYKDSTISSKRALRYIVNMKDFPYDRELVDHIFANNFTWHVALNPDDAYYFKPEQNASPKLICFSKLYDSSYAQVVGLLELQINLNKMIRLLDFSEANSRLFIQENNLYYPVQVSGENRVLLDQPVSAELIRPASGVYDEVSVALEKSDLRFVYLYQVDTYLSSGMRFRFWTAFLLLILPSMLFLLYIYRFTGKLVRFSRHIRNTHKTDLAEFDGHTRQDELGTLVKEYNTMARTIKSLIQSVMQMEKQKNEANYYAMQSQMDPHFLFNTLENIRMQADLNENDNVGVMLFALSRLMRYNLSMRQESTLLSELKHIQNYLMIFQLRQKQRIQYHIDIPDGFTDLNCPFCILQPVVENCIKHGINNMKGMIRIDITLRDEADKVIIEVRDTGAGMTNEAILALNESLQQNQTDANDNAAGRIGLKNVNSRIKYYFGSQYGMTFSNNQPHGLICTLVLGHQPALNYSRTLKT